MTGGENIVSFNYKGKEVTFSLNEGKGEQTGLKKQKELMKNLLDAIKNSDGNKDISQEEFQMMKDLRSIFDATGKGESNAVDDEDEKILKAWNELSKKDKNASVKDFIADQLKKINKKKEEKAKANQTPSAEEQILIEQQKQEEARRLAEAEAEKQRIAQQAEQEKIKAEQEAQQRQITERNNQFDKAMQNKAKSFDKDTLNFTHKITIGENGLNNLFKIAEYALKQEGKANITNKDLYDRIAQIVAANPQIKDVNKINKGDQIFIGTNGQAVRQEQEEVVTEQGQAVVKTDLTGAIDVKADPNLEGWTPGDTMTAEEFSGGTATVYTKTTSEGDNATETKYVYEKDGIKLEANNPETLKAEAKKLNDALAEFSKTDENEAPDVKQTRLQNALDVIKSIGTESAINKAQELTKTHAANLSTEYKAQQNMAILKSMNSALIEQMLGSDGGEFANAVKDSPETQMLIGSLISDLNAKYDNSTITLNEQKVLDILLKCTDDDGVEIKEQAAVPAQDATESTEAVAAKDKVFAKTMKTDSEGVSKYYATCEYLENEEFSASDPDKLNAFLVEMDNIKKAKEADQHLEESGPRAEAVNKVLKSDDKELIKSVLGSKECVFDFTKGAVIELMNKTESLDVLYSVNMEALSEADKKEVQDAINARITAIMDDTTLKALPENQKYLAGVEGVDITGKEGVKITPYGEGNGETKYIHTKDDGTYELKDESSVGDIVISQFADGRLILDGKDTGLDDDGTSIAANSVDELLKLYKDLEALKVTTPPNGETLTAEQKAENLDKMFKMLELCPTEEMCSDIANAIKSGLVDKNDPEAKKIVQKLLLTRDADIVRSIVLGADITDNTDNTLFENDPVALKTVAAMLKEIRDKENAGKRLSAAEISLKNTLLKGVGELEEEIQGLTFDHDGNLIVNPGDNVTGANSMVHEFITNQNSNLVVTDPILKKDKHALASIMNRNELNELSKDNVINLINLPAVDAEILSKIDFSKLESTLVADKDIQDAYIAKAKELFTYTSTEEDQKLDPTSARYLKTILETIDEFNPEVDNNGQKTDADDTVINEILGYFFKEVGEEGSKTLEINNFRQFTYEEMEGLASAVDRYGTGDQKTALANMITVENMENGQFADAIEKNMSSNSIIARLAKLVEAETDPQKVLAMINNTNYSQDLPFDAILANTSVNADLNIIQGLLKNLNEYSVLSPDSKTKLVNLFVKHGNSFGEVDASNYHLLLQTKNGEARSPEEQQFFNFLVDNLANSMYSLAKVYDKAVSDAERKQINDKIDAYITNNATDAAKLVSVMVHFSNNSHAIKELATVNFNNITCDDKTGLREEFFNAAFGNEKSVPEELVYNARENGWIEPVNITVGNTSYEYSLYRYNTGDTVYVLNSGNTETESKLIGDSYKKLYGYVDGKSKAADGVNRADVKDAGNITKDNVLGFITNVPKDSDGNTKVMRKLDNAWFGASAAEMDQIPNALIDYAKEHLDETNEPLKKLIAKMEQQNRVSQGWTKGPEKNDYILGYAKELDKYIQAVVNELEKQKKANSDNNSNS